METNPTDFRVREGDKVNLRDWPTNVAPVYKSKKVYKQLLRRHVAQLNSLQQLLYASNRYALLIIFQGMDATDYAPITHVRLQSFSGSTWDTIQDVSVE